MNGPSHLATIRAIQNSLQSVFDRLDRWFDEDESLRVYRPGVGEWSVAQALEHVSLTNHFLLLTLKKYTTIAERRALRGLPVGGSPSNLERLATIGRRGSFAWMRPDHMAPQGAESSRVRLKLCDQRTTCLTLLNRLPAGIGTLCRVTMTVDKLGKIDLYQWLYFLSQHAERHLQQLDSIKQEFLERSSHCADARCE